MKTITADQLNKKLLSIFRIFGYPKVRVTDNGPPFNSFVCAKFCEVRGIQLTHSPPYHPDSNGIVERAVQTVQSVLKKFLVESAEFCFDLDDSIEQFLANYRNTPHTYDNIVPSHLMFDFKPRFVEI
jgi:transposase InsO family protein